MFPSFSTAEDGSTINEYSAGVTACILSFLTGMHTGWTSPFIPKLLTSEDYPFQISSESASYIAILGPIGDLFGEIGSMLLVDRIGRKNTLVALGTPMLASSLLIYFSYLSPALIYVARFCGGISLGTVTSVNTIYSSEISRPAIRGKMGVIVTFLFTSGTIVVNLIGKYFSMYETSVFTAALTVVFLFTFSLMPKTPYFLLMKGEIEEAAKSLRFFRRTQDVDEELKTLNAAVHRQLSESGKYKDVFAVDTNRRALFLMSFGRIFQQMTGATAFMMYAQNLLVDSSDFMEPQFAVIVIYCLQTCVTFFSGYFSDRCGRVPLLLLSISACSGWLILLGVYFFLRDYPSISIPTSCPIFLLGLFYISFQIGLGSLMSVILGEFFSASIKPKAVCFASITYSLTVIFSTKFYQVSTDYWHPSVAPFSFAFCSMVGTFFITKFYPETAGKSLEEIQMELKSNIGKKEKVIV